ncbi:Ribosome-recycling factor, chloroplastic [Apostasia shenzhenica]|uniref:Ribosome-recycling factor, chloroplastic n=1 Tax=Apostasia shenzhenica TaxID=1088818 RepID=A0A2I0B0H8_9ASPA|nr:Ribosome-recycling factor, chloroplastic [Apostasia shenzhenica]
MVEEALVIRLKGSFAPLGFIPFAVNQRGFAKGRKSKDDDISDTVQVVPDIGPTVKSTALSLMEAAIAALSRELSKIRTGRASAGMLDHIIVETSGVKMPLNRVAVVSVLDAQTLSVTPYDPNVLAWWYEITTEIRYVLAKHVEGCSEPLAVECMASFKVVSIAKRLYLKGFILEGDSLIVIKALCKVITKCAEDVKQSIRRARQKIEEMTKRFIKSAEDMCKAKEKEITGS